MLGWTFRHQPISTLFQGNQFLSKLSNKNLIFISFFYHFSILAICFCPFYMANANCIKLLFCIENLILQGYARRLIKKSSSAIHISGDSVEIVMNELRRFKLSADFLANSSHIIE